MSTGQGSRASRLSLVILLVLAIVSFVVTGLLVGAFKAREAQLAHRWFQRGDHDLGRGAASQAVDEFQTALAYSHDNRQYRLKLALALLAAGRLDEARAHLLLLWENTPADGEINLQLARVYARQKRPSQAIRYYQGATYGIWPDQPVPNREKSQFELTKYLVELGRLQMAEAQAITLASEMPASLQDQVKLGDIFLEVGAPERALQCYRQVLRSDRHNGAANLGAARSEFSLGDFAQAREYAATAKRFGNDSEAAAQLEAQSLLLQTSDPDAPGLTQSQRAERIFSAYKAAEARLNGCAAQNTNHETLAGLDGLMKGLGQVNPARLRRDPGLQSRVLTWTYSLEQQTEGLCGAPQGTDLALLMLAHQRTGKH